METLRCHACAALSEVAVMDCGLLPICNRFLPAPDAREALFPMGVWQCQRCGMAQLVQPAPVSEMKPRVDWLIYNEPEAHLEELIDYLGQLPGISRDSLVGGIVMGNDSTISRFEKRGYSRTWRVHPALDLGVSDPHAGTETVQDRLTEETAASIVSAHGHFDLLIIRHVLEHAHHARTFLRNASKMLKPSGYIVLEVPNCEESLSSSDYTALWEEHIQYFTPWTLRNTLEFAGLEIVDEQNYPPSLVGIARLGKPETRVVISRQELENELNRYRHYSGDLESQKKRVQAFLKQQRERGAKVAFLGAGHLGCVYINLLEIKDHLEFVVDDHPRKRGQFMPGSRLPILGFGALNERGVKLCLSTLGSETEDKIAQNNPEFFQNGGRFLSVLPGRKNSIPIQPCA